MTELRIPGGSESTTSSATPAWQTLMVWASRSHATSEPIVSKKSTILATSVMSGTLRIVTASSVSNVAHRIGKTAFLLPDG